MDNFLKIAACALIAVVLNLAVAKQAKDIAVVIGIISCVLIALIAVEYLSPVITFFQRLRSLGTFEAESMEILFRCVGIGLIAEIISVICADAGNAAIAKTVQLSAGVFVLWLSLPLVSKLIELIEEILLIA